ncbi:hypothetical protein GGI07_001457 [Coemansia sp. Benny D115]|nr:hypothetical protein GGI07_001457 [Coemansia sp. Benny D115]
MSANTFARDNSEKLVLNIGDEHRREGSDQSVSGPSTRLLNAQQQSQQQNQRLSRIMERGVKTAFVLVSLLLLAIVCTYAGSNTIFKSDSSEKGREGLEPLPKNIVGDCRTTGCNNNFECVEVKTDFACFVQPCPKTVFECLPNAMLKDPADAVFSIQPLVPPSGEMGGDLGDFAGGLTEGFFACVQMHGGKSSWKHPTESCNTCRCTAGGGISCTKMMCLDGKMDGLRKAMAKASADEMSHVLTTVMTPVDPPADAKARDPENTSQYFTSVVLDIWN